MINVEEKKDSRISATRPSQFALFSSHGEKGKEKEKKTQANPLKSGSARSLCIIHYVLLPGPPIHLLPRTAEDYCFARREEKMRCEIMAADRLYIVRNRSTLKCILVCLSVNMSACCSDKRDD